MLDVKELSVRYAKSQDLALESISFLAELGEFIVIAGPSGSGKSTLAKTILGLIPAFEEAQIEGKIHFNGKHLSSLTRKERIELLGYVPQYPNDFTTSILVEEEIVFKLENLGIKPSKINQILTDILELLGINNLQNRLIPELSSGELQRISLASALAYLPPILILDEPIARIDPEAEIEITEILKEIANKGHLVLVFEHRLDYMLSKADRLIILDQGKIKSDSKPKLSIQKIKDIDPPEISLLKFHDSLSNILTIEEASERLKSLDENNFNPLETREHSLSEQSAKVIIDCQDLSFRYSRKSEPILDNISFTVPEGQIVGLMGINGSGKSTLFKLLSGVLKPTNGIVKLADRKIRSAKSASKDLVYIPENAKLFLIGPTPLKDLGKIWKDENKAADFYTELGLNHLMKKKLYHLSEGQRRLIAMINTFQLEDKVILLDEPTIALDRKGRHLLQTFLNQAKIARKVVIIASNDPRVFPYFDRIIVLKDKHIIYDDIPRKVLYNLEANTKLIPNQVVRLIQQLKDQYGVELPHFISFEEFNSHLRRTS